MSRWFRLPSCMRSAPEVSGGRADAKDQVLGGKWKVGEGRISPTTHVHLPAVVVGLAEGEVRVLVKRAGMSMDPLSRFSSDSQSISAAQEV